MSEKNIEAMAGLPKEATLKELPKVAKFNFPESMDMRAMEVKRAVLTQIQDEIL